jgi:phosphoglycolate phosphatase
VDGLAVAVASDEAKNGSGRFDDWKYRRLLEVGADVVVSAFRDAEPLINCISYPRNFARILADL